jgi:hypothetical protein
MNSPFRLALAVFAPYRRMLAAVMQDDQLLAGSRRDNISFFDPLPGTPPRKVNLFPQWKDAERD